MERNGDFKGGMVFILTRNFRSYYYLEIPAALGGLDVEALALAIPHLQESQVHSTLLISSYVQADLFYELVKARQQAHLSCFVYYKVSSGRPWFCLLFYGFS